MILSGILIGWLPYVLERLDTPKPREVVARHGWAAANEHAVATRKHRIFLNALWGGGLAVLFFALAPVSYLISDMDKAGWVTFMLVIIPVVTGLLVLRVIVKKTRKSGQVTRPQPLDMSVDENPGTLGEPEKLTSIPAGPTAVRRPAAQEHCSCRRTCTAVGCTAPSTLTDHVMPHRRCMMR